MIDKYLISNCLHIIDEFNERFKDIEKDELKTFADTEFCEADLVVRLGYPFRHMASFNMQGKANDIVVKLKDFIIEVKYLRNFKSSNGTYSNKILWEEAFGKNCDWLINEIKNNKKGHRAFILGWFNAYDGLNSIMQLGEGKGSKPEINQSRYRLFPFINYKSEMKTTENIFYEYPKAYETQSLQIIGYDKDVVNCMFFGMPEDKFHFALYW